MVSEFAATYSGLDRNTNYVDKFKNLGWEIAKQ